MLLKTEKNWKNLLTPEDERRLNDMLEQIKKHRGAYFNADDVKQAQLWCALLEARKENAALDARLKRLEYMLNGMLVRSRVLDRSANRLLDSLNKF